MSELGNNFPPNMDESPPHPPSNEASPPPPPPQGGPSGSPNDFLKAIVGKRVVVRLLSGVDYRGEFELDVVTPSDSTISIS
jgi:hypothetical protein